jgi:hypothetical protein
MIRGKLSSLLKASQDFFFILAVFNLANTR